MATVKATMVMLGITMPDWGWFCLGCALGLIVGYYVTCVYLMPRW